MPDRPRCEDRLYGIGRQQRRAPVPDAVERRYALRLVMQRLHQAAFRDLVLAAYDHRCAITNLPDDHLLDAAHIMADATSSWASRSSPTASRSPSHHAAFDNHLIGIDPDGRVHVSERLLMLHDGPLLEQSLKACAGVLIRPPKGKQFGPDRERLAARFDQFKRVA